MIFDPVLFKAVACPHKCCQVCLTVVRALRLDSSLPLDGLKEHSAYVTRDPAKVFCFFSWMDCTWGCGYAEDDLHPKCFPACLHSTRQTASSANTCAAVGPKSFQCSMQAQIRAQRKQRRCATSSNMMQDDSQCSCFLNCVFCHLFFFGRKDLA